MPIGESEIVPDYAKFPTEVCQPSFRNIIIYWPKRIHFTGKNGDHM